MDNEQLTIDNALFRWKPFVFSVAAVIALIFFLAPGAAAEESLTYLFGGNTSIYLNRVERTNVCLDVVCPDYFSINSDGSLKLTLKPDPYFIEAMHRKGIKVRPFVSNHWDRALGRKALANTAAFVSSLAGMIEEYDLDGVDIDLQNLNQDDRAAFTEFMRVLRARVPASKTVSVCVAANPGGWTTGWHGQYDTAALGKICSHILIMTYDESYESGPAGPVASLSFMEKSIQNALQYTTPDKLMLGIPFYGRYWVAGQSYGGKALTVSDIRALAEHYGTRVWYDGKHECARATLTITPQHVTQGLWGGKKLSAGTYDVWYEDSVSYERKLALVRKYGLRGVGCWALGQEPESVWQAYYGWLKGLSFSDTEYHWAGGVIERVKDAGLIAGLPNGSYAPDRPMTRGESIALTCRMAGIQPVAAKNLPPDAQGHWSANYLAGALRAGLITGLPDGSLRPDAAVSRAEMAVLLSKVLHLPDTVDKQQKSFPDVSVYHWASRAILTLAVHEVIGGTPDGSYLPERPLTRAEAAQIVYNTFPLPKDFPGTPLGEPYMEPR